MAFQTFYIGFVVEAEEVGSSIKNNGKELAER